MLQKIWNIIPSWNNENSDSDEPIRNNVDNKDNEGNYKWDNELKLGDDNFGEKINSNNYDQNAAKKNPFPNDYLLAKFSDLAYQSKGYWLPEDWELLTTAHNEGDTNGYFGVAFWNPKLCQVVVAHRGTDIKVRGARRSDRQLAFNNEKTEQSQSAATFVHQISEEIKSKIRNSSTHIQLSITGHSLGAWLAQITTFTVKYLKKEGIYLVEDENYLDNIHVHTVVFDCPGCEIALQKMRQRFVDRYENKNYMNYNSLDMTVYLNEPSCINCVNGHVGTIYLTNSTTHTIDDVLALFDADYKIDKKIILDFPQGKLTALLLAVTRFGFRFRANKTIKTDYYVENEHSLNVFSEQELHFILTWYFAAGIASHNVMQLKKKYLLPEFKINYKKNVFISDNLAETIASIKSLRPTGDLIFQNLQESEQDTILYEELKFNTDEYYATLRTWNNYYFKDKYNLETFLPSKARILHIYVDSQKDMNLEVSIFCNVFKYYQEQSFLESKTDFNSEQFGILRYGDTLRKMIRSNIFHKYGINLLFIDWCSTDPSNIETIMQLLEIDKTIKIVVSAASWNNYDFKDKYLMEVAGYGNNIKFQHLLEASQQKLLTENKLILYDKSELRLQDVVKEDSFLCNEVLLGLLEMPPGNGIAIPYHNNTFIHAVWYRDIHYEIKPIEHKIKDDKQLHYLIEDAENQDLPSNFQCVFDGACRPTNIPSKSDFELKCSNLQNIVYLFRIDNEKLFLTKIYNQNFYIPRSVCHIKFIDGDSIFKCRDEDLFYFCGNEEAFDNKLAQSRLNNEQKERFRFLTEVSDSLKQRNENVHLFEIQNDEIIWLYSNRHINSLRRHILPREKLIPEHQLLMSDENVVIISGGAGMGKSSTIGSLFEHHKKQNHWVFALPLGQAAFSELIGENTFETAAQFILKSCNIFATDFIKCLLSYCLQNKTEVPVYLLFDAYDEIYKQRDRRKLLSLFGFLKDQSTAKILITTRKYTCEEIENKLSIFASSFKIPDYATEIQAFFTEFWYTQQRLFESVANSKQLKEFANNLFQHMKGNLENTIFNLKALPLYTRMIAEIITPPLNPASSSAAEQTINNVLDLYKEYIQIHYNIYFRRTQPNENAVQQIWLLESISRRLHKLAVIKLTNMILTDVNSDELNELNKVGLVQSTVYEELPLVESTSMNLVNANIKQSEVLHRFALSQSNLHYNLEFLHESLRDYFVADVLQLWLQSHSEPFHNTWNIEKFIVSDFLTKREYKDVRFFLNSQIENVGCQGVRMSESRIKQCQETLNLLGDSALIADDNESAFHICIKENLCSLSKYFLFEIIDTTSKVKLLCSRNFNLETPLYLAIAAMNNQNTQLNNDIIKIFLDEMYQWSYDDSKEILLATLCTYFVTDEHIEHIKECSKNYTDNEKLLDDVLNCCKQAKLYLQVCKTNSYENLEQIFQILKDDVLAKKYLLLRTNENKETGLHLTKSEDVLKFLIQNGAELNFRDHHGLTALNRAIKRKLTNIAITLIQEKADITIGDNFGYAPLIFAAKHNNLEVVSYLIENVPEIDLNQTTTHQATALMLATKYGNYKIVEYLLIKGADINATDRNGMNVVHHAVKGDHSKLIRLFVNGDAKIDLQDQNGVTPLLYSIQKEKWSTVNSLLDNDADVRIGSYDHVFPVDLLRQKGKERIIKKINNINKNKKRETYAINQDEGINNSSENTSEN